MAVVLRDATYNDLQAILDIFNEEVVNSTVIYVSNTQSLEARKIWYDERIRDGYPVIVATNGSDVVGFGTYGLFRPGYKYTVEHSVYVHKDHRGQGVSKLILEWLIKHAKDHGYHVMMAGIDADNSLSIRLHQKYGFEEVAHMKQVGFKFGRWLDAKLLQLTFDTPTNPV